MLRMLIVVFILFVSSMLSDLNAESTKKKKVNHIFTFISYHQSHIWTNSLLDAIISGTKHLPENLIFENVVAFDGLRVYDREAWQRTFDEALPQLQSGRYAMILALDDIAVQMILKNYDKIPHDLPIVFGGYESCTPDFKEKYPNITGVTQYIDIFSTMQLAAKLYPQADNVIVISDAADAAKEAIGRQWQDDPKLANIKLKFIAPDIEDNIRLLQTESEKSLLFIAPWRTEYISSRYQSLVSIGIEFAKYSEYPYFVSEDTFIGYGALGGYMTLTAEHGAQVAELVEKVFTARSACDIPIVKGKLTPVFDYNLILENGLDTAKLPANSILLNKPLSLWELHKRKILAFAGLVLLSILFLAVLLIVMARSRSKIKLILDALPGRVGIINESEEILFLNAAGVETDYVIKKLKDFPSFDYELVSNTMHQIFADGKIRTVDYDVEGVMRSVSIARLPEKAFGQRAIVWFSHDNSQLQEARKEATEYAAALKKQTKIWNILINSLPLFIFAKDPDNDFRYLFGNKTIADFYGVDSDSIQGRLHSDFIRVQDEAAKVLAQDLATLSDPDNTNQYPVTLHDAKGIPHYFTAIRRIVTNDDGTRLLLGAAINITDLTEMAKNEQILRRSLELIMRGNDDIYEGIKDFLSRVCTQLDASRCYIVKFNHAEETIKFYAEVPYGTNKQIFDKKKVHPFPKWTKRFYEENLISCYDVYNKLEEFGFQHAEYFIKEHEIRSIYSLRIMVDNDLWGYIGVNYEGKMHSLTSIEENFITSAAYCVGSMIKHKAYADSLIEAKAAAEAANKAKSLFIAGISHEIRTPLNSVIGFADLLQDKTVDEYTRVEYLANISSAGHALLDLINDVLDMSKLEAEKIVFKPEHINFEKIVKDIGAIFKQQLSPKKIKGIYEIKPMPELYLDRIRLRQILFNLMGNAVKFTMKGELKFIARFEEKDDKTGTLCFDVVDTGIGISEEDQKRLFTPFVQAQGYRGTYADNNGTGLGLAIVKRLVEQMNGNISLKSTLGVGSTFSVQLENVAYLKGHNEIQKNEAKTVNPVLESSGKILIVDDVALNLKVLAAMLKKCGYETLSAPSGKEALELLERNPDISCVLTDLWMPDMRGEELAEIIRKNYSSIRLVAVTADMETTALQNKLFDEIIFKPLDFKKLKFKLSSIIV